MMGKEPTIPTVGSLNNEFIKLTKSHFIWSLHDSKLQEFLKGGQTNRSVDIKAAPYVNISAKRRVENPYFQLTSDV